MNLNNPVVRLPLSILFFITVFIDPALFANEIYASKLGNGKKLEKEAISYYNAGDYRSAISAYDNAALAFQSKGKTEDYLRCAYKSVKLQFGLVSTDSILAVIHNLIAITKKELVQNNILLSTGYKYLANFFYQNHDIDSSYYYYKQSIKLCEESIIKDATSLSTSYRTLGCYYFNEYKLDSAILYLDKSIEVLDTNDNTYNSIIAESYRLLGLTYLDKAEYNKSLDFLKKSERIKLKLFDEYHPEMIEIYSGMGRYYSFLGDFIKARTYYKKSLVIKENLYGQDHKSVATALNDIGNTYIMGHDLEKAKDYYIRSLKIREQAGLTNTADYAMTINNMGIIYYIREEMDLAKTYFKQALNIEIKTLGKYHPDIAWGYINIGNIYEECLETDKALEYYQKALDIQLHIMDTIHKDVSATFGNLGNTYEGIEKYDSALHYHYIALKIDQQLYDSANIEIADDWSNIGVVYEHMKDYNKALEAGYNALEIYQKTLPDKHPKLGRIYNNLAYSYTALKRLDTADSLLMLSIRHNYKDSLPMHFGIPDINLKEVISKQKLLVTFHNACDVSWYKYLNNTLDNTAIEELKDRLTETDILIEEIRNDHHSDFSKLFLAEKAHEFYTLSVAVYSYLYKSNNDPKYLQKAYLYSEKNKANVLLSVLQESKAKEFSNIPDSLIEREKELKEELQELEQMLLQYDEIEYDSLKAKLDEQFYLAEKELINLHHIYENDYPTYYHLKFQSAIPESDELIKKLSSVEALISYTLSDSILYIFCITSEGLVLMEEPITPKFNEQLTNFLKSIKRTRINEYESGAIDLYERLIKPVSEYLSHKDKLIIIPDGILYYLPFETLIEKPGKEVQLEKDLKYLINQFAVSYHYSGTLWYQSETNNEGIKSLLGYAPVFDQVNTKGYVVHFTPESSNENDLNLALRSIKTDDEYITPLEYSELEVNTIADLLKKNLIKTTAYFHDQATEGCFKEEVNDYNVIHLATHGIFNEDKPNWSGLLFYPVSDPAEIENNLQNQSNDGILYSSEMYNLSLNADLFVLSACESGLGKIKKGEGVISLSRGLLYSGANNLLISLWKVPDKSTYELMTNFYTNVLTEPDYSIALRKAKLKMISNKSTAFPSNWAGFVLIGK